MKVLIIYKTIVFILFAGLLIACGSTKEVSTAEREALDEAVSTSQFSIEAKWAYPLSAESAQVLNNFQPAGVQANGNRIYIENGAHYLTVKNDSVSVNLPYFGTTQISRGNPGDVGIKIDETLENLEWVATNKPNERVFRLETKEKGESFDFSIRLFATGRATMVLNTSHRQSIRYEGSWEPSL